MPKYLIGCFSGWKYDRRRELCYTTWFRDAARCGVDRVFVMGVGVPKPERYDDFLFLPCEDNYATLPQRTALFCKWALTVPDWTHLVKLDDDTFVSIPRLALYTPTGKYVGSPVKFQVPYAQGGAGYIIDRDATQIISRYLTRERGAEDKHAGIALKEHGISLTVEKRLIAFGSDKMRPRVDNNFITAHRISGDIWTRAYIETGMKQTSL